MAFHSRFSIADDEIQGLSKIVRKRKYVAKVISFLMCYFAFERKV